MSAPSNLDPAYEKARHALRLSDPRAIAARADVLYRESDGKCGVFAIRYFDRRYEVAYPDGTVAEADSAKEASVFTQILLLHYLTTADGTPLRGEWVTFRQLPNGLMYERAFRARSLDPLAARFGSDADRFAAAAQRTGGEPARLGDRSFLFRALPRLPLLCVLWLGDEEMPAEANILFDASAGRYLPTEDLAAVGGALSGRLLRAAAAPV